ncbi:protein ACCELERATED CELL DEATH 6-like [Cornus florida]|uniref:protein ACCELERATED CELL DEATH 6-like n=1 Tax=Cornus florida TaxID=4283 RepID=UPI0028A13AD8|nr:protein ACCELERATED CELL DEATH 6-like [Cornus florida]
MSTISGCSTVSQAQNYCLRIDMPIVMDINKVAQAEDGIHIMNSQLYGAVTSGDPVRWRSELESNNLEQLSPQGNTVLHLAISLGHHQLVESILQRCSPNLFSTKNSAGKLALHLAAASGNLSTLESLLRHAAKLQLEGYNTTTCVNGDQYFNQYLQAVLMEKDSEMNTALHVAMKYQHYKLAILLVEKNPQVSTCPNKEKMSPLYMAAEAGQLKLVELMMQNGAVDIRALQGKSVVHAAIKARNKDVLKAVLKHESTYFSAYDEDGRTPLSFASSIGYFKGVRCFLKKWREAIYIRDADGSLPIHLASMRGHVKIIKKFLKYSPDSRELVNKDGQNILHVAAMNGKANVVSYVLKKHELAMLINQRDEKDGNTPLHLASKGEHARIVHILTWDKRVNLEITNDIGLTALDVATDDPRDTTFQKRLTWLSLRYAGAPQTEAQKTRRSTADHEFDNINAGESPRVNTLLLVATLVATVTFAAGFTVPGGNYGTDDPYQAGMATLVKRHMFHFFLITNTISLYSSVIVAICLIWAMLNNIHLSLYSLKWAIPLGLGISLLMVSLAFMAAVFLVVRNITWLAALVLIIGSISTLSLWLVFVPLSFPNSLKNRVARNIFRYPLYLMALVTEE